MYSKKANRTFSNFFVYVNTTILNITNPVSTISTFRSRMAWMITTFRKRNEIKKGLFVYYK